MAVSTKRKHPTSKPTTAHHSNPQKAQKTLDYTINTRIKHPTPSPKPATDFTTTMAAELALIAASTKTPYEKRVLSLLCQIPRGSVSTYGLMAAHLGSSPRAVGNVMRRNPFAPAVPCHRVVATGGTLGGYKGHWTKKDGEGITLEEKRVLLRGEGVKIDAAGRVLGTPFCGFV